MTAEIGVRHGARATEDLDPLLRGRVVARRGVGDVASEPFGKTHVRTNPPVSGAGPPPDASAVTCVAGAPTTRRRCLRSGGGVDEVAHHAAQAPALAAVAIPVPVTACTCSTLHLVPLVPRSDLGHREGILLVPIGRPRRLPPRPTATMAVRTGAVRRRRAGRRAPADGQ